MTGLTGIVVPAEQAQLGLWYTRGQECAITDHHWVEEEEVVHGVELLSGDSLTKSSTLTECSRCGLTLEEFHHRAARDQFTTSDIQAAMDHLTKANLPIDIAIGEHLNILAHNGFNLQRGDGETDAQLRARMVSETVKGMAESKKTRELYQVTHEGMLVTPEEMQKAEEKRCIKDHGKHKRDWETRVCVRCGHDYAREP